MQDREFDREVINTVKTYFAPSGVEVSDLRVSIKVTIPQSNSWTPHFTIAKYVFEHPNN